MIVIGVDLSMTSTGLARIDTERGEVAVATITTKPPKMSTLLTRDTRLEKIENAIWSWSLSAYLVVIEGPAFSSTMGSAHDRSGLWWRVVAHQINAGRKVVEVPPTSRIKYATGKGNASKDAVLAAVVRRYSWVETANNDEADSLVLAAMGARSLGFPIEESLSKEHLAAMDKMKWL